MRAPLCGNEQPYCPRGGREMRCVRETVDEWVFRCSGCEQVNIITKPEYRRQLREQVRRTNGIRLFR
jgi:hypothetical protein